MGRWKGHACIQIYTRVQENNTVGGGGVVSVINKINNGQSSQILSERVGSVRNKFVRQR